MAVRQKNSSEVQGLDVWRTNMPPSIATLSGHTEPTRPDVTDSTPIAVNRPDGGADTLVLVTSKTLARVRRSAVLTTVSGLSILLAGPASAEVPEGWSNPEPVPVLEALLILAGIPLLLIVVISAAVYVPAIVRGERVAPNAPEIENQWFGGPRSGTRELETADRGEGGQASETGGAGGRW
jgi:hypothetical protein